ncbi:hypothetical protein NL676_000386 [Syzygium grande]|nr:hypothetical protein NL676_000386 [Syzygium grande]
MLLLRTAPRSPSKSGVSIKTNRLEKWARRGGADPAHLSIPRSSSMASSCRRKASRIVIGLVRFSPAPPLVEAECCQRSPKISSHRMYMLLSLRINSCTLCYWRKREVGLSHVAPTHIPLGPNQLGRAGLTALGEPDPISSGPGPRAQSPRVAVPSPTRRVGLPAAPLPGFAST